MDIKPIRDETATIARFGVWRICGTPRNVPSKQLSDVLTTLIEAYERAHYPVDLANPIEAIKFRLQQR
jgi:HTH-type transcriptional regulator/antitoxin HigA